MSGIGPPPSPSPGPRGWRVPSLRIRPSRQHLLRRLSYIVGAVVAASGVAMLPAAAVGAVYGEWRDALGIVLAAAITVGAGLLGWRVVGRRGRITTREGFAAVGLSWIVMSAFGTLPYLLTGSITNLTDAFFETAAGFTTTGASVVPEPGALSHGVLIWRAGAVKGVRVALPSTLTLPLR